MGWSALCRPPHPDSGASTGGTRTARETLPQVPERLSIKVKGLEGEKSRYDASLQEKEREKGQAGAAAGPDVASTEACDTMPLAAAPAVEV